MIYIYIINPMPISDDSATIKLPRHLHKNITESVYFIWISLSSDSSTHQYCHNGYWLGQTRLNEKCKMWDTIVPTVEKRKRKLISEIKYKENEEE